MIFELCPTLSRDLIKREFLNTSAAFGVLVLLGFAAGMIFPDMAQQTLQNFAAQIEQQLGRATASAGADPALPLEALQQSLLLRQAAKFIFRRFPLQLPVWVGFGSNGKVTEFSIGKSSEYAEKSG
jgi:hypothetical protein